MFIIKTSAKKRAEVKSKTIDKKGEKI